MRTRQCPDLWKPVSYETDNEQSHRQVVIAAAIGAIVELVVFTISQVTARNLYIILGGLAGAALALVLQRYWLAVQPINEEEEKRSRNLAKRS